MSNNIEETTLAEQDVNRTDWFFRLTIHNNTKYELKVGTCVLNIGQWYTQAVRGKAPVSVGPGRIIEAFGVRGIPGSGPYGYEATGSWTIKTKAHEGKLDLMVDVPYWSKNKSYLHATGAIKVEGWQPLPKDGKAFKRSITIVDKGEGLIAEVQDEAIVPNDKFSSHEQWGLPLTNEESISDWPTARSRFEAVKALDPVSIIPKQYRFPNEAKIVARSVKHLVDKSNWKHIDDPDYKTDSDKKNYVDEYFFVSYYSLNTNSAATESIAAGSGLVTTRSIEYASMIKSTLQEVVEIEASIKAEGEVLAAEVSTAFRITNIREESSSKIERETRQTEIPSKEINRIFVPWVISQSLALYRKAKGKELYKLIAVSEWPRQVINEVYDYPSK